MPLAPPHEGLLCLALQMEFDGRPLPFPSGAAPRPAKPGAMPIAHAPGFAVPSAVAVQEVAAVTSPSARRWRLVLRIERRNDRHGSFASRRLVRVVLALQIADGHVFYAGQVHPKSSRLLDVLFCCAAGI